MHDFSSFVRLVHEVYPRLHDRVFLQDHPLLGLLGGPVPLEAERLHRTLIDALEWLRPIGSAAPASVEWRRYRHLQSRYLDGASPEQIAQELQVSPRQARRDHSEALDEVARMLWSRLVRTDAAALVGPGPAAPTAPPRTVVRSTTARPADSLDAEISNLTAAAAVPTRVAEVVRSVAETVSRLAESHDVRIVVDAPRPLDPVAMNRTVLRQLLLNLLSDAIVHHPGATIEVHTDVSDRSPDPSISIAISPGDGAEATDPENGRGSLGISAAVLDVSERLARSQGGSLQGVAGPGRAIVSLTLPASHARTLLVVDDNPDVSLLFRRYLGDTDFHLVQARSAERALRLARELRPEIVFLDVLMPSHDGWEILQALRADPVTASLPVVICSVIPDHALAYSLGVTDFLSKPVTRQGLLDVLARLPREPRDGGRPGPPESIDTARPRAARPTD